MIRLAAVVGLFVVGIAACSGSDDGDPDENRVLRIDGPATVEDDVGADQD